MENTLFVFLLSVKPVDNRVLLSLPSEQQWALFLSLYSCCCRLGLRPCNISLALCCLASGVIPSNPSVTWLPGVFLKPSLSFFSEHSLSPSQLEAEAQVLTGVRPAPKPHSDELFVGPWKTGVHLYLSHRAWWFENFLFHDVFLNQNRWLPPPQALSKPPVRRFPLHIMVRCSSVCVLGQLGLGPCCSWLQFSGVQSCCGRWCGCVAELRNSVNISFPVL